MTMTDKPASEVEEAAERDKEALWIRRKLGLPPDASMFDVFGQMHTLHSNAHGYVTYIAAYRCDDKQGEIARLTVELAALQARLAEREGEIAKLNTSVALLNQMCGEALEAYSQAQLKAAAAPDADSLIAWLKDPHRKPPELAFTSGKEREIADWINVMLGGGKVAAACDDSRPVDAMTESPWPLSDTVAKLVEGCVHLLDDHNCDQHGHEQVRAAVNVAKAWLAALRPGGAG